MSLGLAPPYPWWRRGNPQFNQPPPSARRPYGPSTLGWPRQCRRRPAPRPWVGGRPRSAPPWRAARGVAIVPQSNKTSAINPGGTRRLVAQGLPHRDLTPWPDQKRPGRRAMRVLRRARCATGGNKYAVAPPKLTSPNQCKVANCPTDALLSRASQPKRTS